MGMPTLSDRAPDGDNLHTVETLNDERTDEYTASRYTVETCASEVLALRLALSLIENGAEPAGVIAAVRRRDALCAKARRALRANKDLNRALAVAKRTGIAFGRLEEIDRTNCGVTPGEARAILTAFAAEGAQPANIREEEWLPPNARRTPNMGGEY